MKEIREIVADLVEEYGTNDPVELAEALGVIVKYKDLGGLSGMYLKYNEQPIILLNSNLEEHDLIFAWYPSNSPPTTEKAVLLQTA